jgi:histidinol dehydrogenase
LAEVDARVQSLPRRELAIASLGSAKAILTPDLATAVAVSNLYAPEHLSLAVADPEPLVDGIRNAGAVFAGHAAAETFGDYLAGSSHVLPTDGAARSWSGVSVHSFLKAMTVQHVSAEAARAHRRAPPRCWRGSKAGGACAGADPPGARVSSRFGAELCKVD